MRTPKVTFTVEKKSGPKTEPWGTLQEMATVNSLNTASKGNFLLNHYKYYYKTVPGNLGAVPPPNTGAEQLSYSLTDATSTTFEHVR